MAQVFDARDPGFRTMNSVGVVALCVALALAGGRLAAAADVEINLDVLKTLPASKSGEAGKAIELTPPSAQRQNIGRREDALRRARQRWLIEQAKRKAAARKKAEAARKAAAKKKAEDAQKAAEAQRAEEAKQSEEIERKAKADREDAAARAAQAAREAKAARAAEAAKKADATAAKAAAESKAAKAAAESKAAKAAAEIKAAKAAGEIKAAKARAEKATVVPQKAPVKEAAKTATKPKGTTGGKKQIATRTEGQPLGKARLLFGKESAALSKAEKQKLAPIAAKMISEEKALLVIYAYAAGDGSNTSDARRLSLSRALAVRQAITVRGIPEIRIEIRALGAHAGAGPSDRVDLVLVQR